MVEGFLGQKETTARRVCQGKSLIASGLSWGPGFMQSLAFQSGLLKRSLRTAFVETVGNSWGKTQLCGFCLILCVCMSSQKTRSDCSSSSWIIWGNHSLVFVITHTHTHARAHTQRNKWCCKYSRSQGDRIWPVPQGMHCLRAGGRKWGWFGVTVTYMCVTLNNLFNLNHVSLFPHMKIWKQ